MSGFETRKQTSLLRQNGNLVKRNEGAPRTEGKLDKQAAGGSDLGQLRGLGHRTPWTRTSGLLWFWVSVLGSGFGMCVHILRSQSWLRAEA